MTADTTPTTALDLDAIRYRLAEATPGPWEAGDRWLIAGVLSEQFGEGKCAWCKAYGEPQWTGKRSINGRTMLAHHHRNTDEHLDLHRIVAGPDVYVAGNYDYESGGIIEPADAQFIAHARQDIPALLTEVDRLRAELAATPGQAEPLTADVDLAAWCAKLADAHRYYEAPHPGDDRDRGLVEWVVMALGNPEQPGARQVLAVLAARHHDELTPTGTAAWLKSLVAELTAERDRVRAERDDDRAEMQELRAELAEAHAQCRRLNRELDDVRAAAEAVAR